MIDTHIHIDFYDNSVEIIREIVKEDISAIFVTHLPELYEKQKFLVENIPQVFLAVGFHPILVNEYDFREDLFINALCTTKFVGEVGLDFAIARSEKSRTKQVEVFKKICKNVNGHILSIHSRHAEKEVLDILCQYKIQNAIFHWYTGPISRMLEILEEGHYFSLNPAMLRSNKGKSIMKEIPLNRVLIETDGPFTKYNGNIVSPMYLREIYSAFGDFYGVDNMEEVVFQNMSAIIG